MQWALPRELGLIYIGAYSIFALVLASGHSMRLAACIIDMPFRMWVLPRQFILHGGNNASRVFAADR
jgi:hypothetical protein